ncbi:MAG: argininosuccinate synthase [Spirochaetia bacterium]|jgi:argininosuccinate synthase|nr:argininosuccinate synthase [Spirochaetia bacterium]
MAGKKENTIKKIALAYSGGLDTSIIIPWLKEHYPGSEIVCVCTNVGQKEEWDKIEEKAIKSGASKIYIEDIKEEFVKDYIFPMIRAGAIYEGKYLLGTSIARPVQAKRQVEIALEEGADALAHGCTGKGNDQVRFELTYKALAPHLKVIAPWRIWDINSREDAIEYAVKHNIPLGNITKKNIYSRDENIWHTSHEGGELEDPWQTPPESIYQRTASLESAPDKAEEVIIEIEKGYPTALNGKKLSPYDFIDQLNKIAGPHSIGRADIVETRTVGMKSHGVYETPAGTVLNKALQELEMICLDNDTLHYKQLMAIKYSELIYVGKWFTPLREALEAFMEESSRFLTGTVRLYLYKGNVLIGGRKSPYSLYIEDLASFGESSYNQHDATGFINLFGLSTGVTAIVHNKITQNTGQVKDIKQIASIHEE